VAAVTTLLSLTAGSGVAAVSVASAATVIEDRSPALAPLGSGDARALLEAARRSIRSTPHVGSVTVVTFTAGGPLVAAMEVQVGPMGDVQLRQPTRWLLGAQAGGFLRTPAGQSALGPVAAPHAMNVDRILENWTASVGPPRWLDTGPATSVHLKRIDGSQVEEVLYVDHATSLPVRRETRAADGSVLRVVAYTSLEPVTVPSGSKVYRTTSVTAPPLLGFKAGTDQLREDGYVVPDSLAGGFALLSVEEDRGMTVARYGDGLSVLSTYQQLGRLDSVHMQSATIRHVANRDVWTWPGREPLRVVWTSDDHTWTLVTDAPFEVVEDALVSLPGDLVGHDVPSRIQRGVVRVWSWARGLLD
jgi:hypothetical protein